MIYYLLIMLGLIVVLGAQININSSYKKYKKISLSKRISGQEVARKILDANNLQNVYVVATNGELSDHYDPSRKVVKLSYDVFHGETIAAAAVAAHECGHAIQDKEGYFFMVLRSVLVPIVNLISYLGYFGLIVSIFAGITGYIKLSILVLLATILFQLVTLPVEFNASRRAKEQLEKLGLVDSDELNGTSKMLFSAALTYVASLLSNLLQLLRLILILGRHDD